MSGRGNPYKWYARGRGNGGSDRGREHGSGGHDRGGGHGSDRGRGRGGGGGARGRGRGGGSRHPPGLKGAEIGRWYSKQSRGKKRQREISQRAVVSMNSQQASKISQLLYEVKSKEQEAGPSTASQVSSSWKAKCKLNERVRDFYMSQLERESCLDTFLMDELKEKKESNMKYQEMQEFRKKLPSYNMKEKLTELINNNQVTVISGETGCGKTTQVPQFILDDYIARGQGSLCRVVCTQPRRISAISVAERVAAERGEPCGQDRSTGYQIRLDHKFPRVQGSILYCTTGILLKWMESDGLLQSVSHVVLDEIHERDILSDFLLIIMKDVLPKRPNLKLILMSATLNANMFSEYFGNCPTVDIPGFTFPVTEFWIEDILGMIQYRPSCSAPKKEPKWWKYARRKKCREDELRKQQEFFDKLDDYVVAMRDSYSEDIVNSVATMDHDNFDLNLGAEIIKYICLKKPQGAILMFLPGWDQISKMNDMLMKEGIFRSSSYRIIPLHSMMPSVNQRQVFDRPPEGVRKIIIATNIAETSITIDDVVYVIDMGRVKESNFDLKLNLSTLKSEWVSKASAHQRRGRAGRVQPGECYHAYSQLKADLMEDYQLPEMLRTPLESLCLRIKTLNLGLIEPFISKALQPPDPHAITLAVQTLHQLKALDVNEDLTALGYHLSLLPVNPRIGKIILFGAMFCCLDPVLTIAASLDFKDPFVIPLGKEAIADRKRKELSEGSCSDHIMLVNAFNQWEDARINPRMEEEFCWDNFLSKNTLKMLDNMKGQFCELLYDIGFVNSRSCKHDASNRNSDNHALIKASLCAGLYPNICKLQPIPGINKHTGKPRKPKITTFQDGKVEMHLKSVIAEESYFPSRWLMYHTKIKSTCVFIHDASPIDPYPLLFFGGEVSMINDDGHETICIDNDIRFHAPFEIAKLVKGLKTELDKVLAIKIEKPGATDWSSKTTEGRIMKAITDLLSSGEIGYNGPSSSFTDGGTEQYYRYDRCEDWW